MKIFLFLYLIPAILDLLLYKKTYDEYKITKNDPNIMIVYLIICFMPVMNILSLIYAIIDVCQFFKKD